MLLYVGNSQRPELGLAAAPASTAPSAMARPQPARSRDCVINDNINSRGERIYHVPGQRYYEQTIVDESRGECCSEADATAEGWRRSKV